MIKVIIADDEVLVRIGIKSTIEWEKYGFTIVAEAQNGEEALRKIEQLHPDVLLTDIRMPKMDGIELMRQLEERNIQIQTVIMSCYNDFELVRSAMKYGAADYLLKLSLAEEDLVAVLERLKVKIQNRMIDSVTEVDIYKKENELVHMLLGKDGSIEVLKSIGNELNLDPRFPNVKMMILSIDRVFLKEDLEYQGISSNTRGAVRDLAVSYLSNHNSGRLLALENGDFLVILNLSSNYEKIYHSISEQVKEYLNFTVSAGVFDGKYCSKEDNFHLDQQIEAFETLRYHSGPGKIYDLQDTESVRQISQKSRINVSACMSEIRGIADFPKLPSVIRCLTERISAQMLTLSASQQIFAEVFYILGASFQAYGGDINGINEMFSRNFSELLHQVQYLKDVESWFTIYVNYATKYCQSCCNQWKRSDILSAILYTQENFDQQISSNIVAQKIGISNAYFSTLFKQETGYSFTEYLTSLRIEKSKRLLEDKSIYIYEIGMRVGYMDSNYFCKVFKKQTGISPETYRKKRGI